MSRKQRRLQRAIAHRREVIRPTLVKQKRLAVELARVDTASINEAKRNAKILGGTVTSGFFRTTGFAQNRPLSSYGPDFLAAFKEVLRA